MQRRAMRAGTCGLCRMAEKSRPLAFQWSKAWRGSSISTRPTISLNVRKPSWAMYWRTCSAMKKKKLMTCSGWPWNFARRAGSCVAMPTLALELCAQGGILRSDAHRASVQVALAHHDAAHGDQGGGGKAEFLGSEQRGDGDVAAGLQLAIGLDADAPAQDVQNQHLLGLGEAQLPRDTGVLVGAEVKCPGAAAIAADEHDVGMGFGYARGHRA